MAESTFSDGKKGNNAEALPPESDFSPARPAIMAGTDLIGSAAVPMSEMNRRDASLHQSGSPDPQHLLNDRNMNNSVYGLANSDKAMLAQASGNLGGLTSSTIADEILYIKEEKNKKDAEAYRLALLDTWDDMWDAVNDMAEDLADLQNATNEAMEGGHDALDALSQAREELDLKLQQQKEEVELLEKALKDAAPSDRQALEQQLIDAQHAVTQTEGMRQTYIDATGELGTRMYEASESVKEHEKVIRDLQEKIKNARSSGVPESELVALRTQLIAAQENKKIAEHSVEDLKKTANFAVEMTRLSKDGSLNLSDVAQLKELAGHSQSSKEIISNLIGKMTGAGVAVVGADGMSMSADDSSKYLYKEMGITDIDLRLYEIEKKLALDPNNQALKDEDKMLREQRAEAESKTGACFGDMATNQRVADIKTLPEYQAVLRAAQDLKTVSQNTVSIGDALVFKDEGGRYILKKDTKDFAVDEQPNADELKSLIENQLGAGKSLATAEVGDKLSQYKQAQANLVAAAGGAGTDSGFVAGSVGTEALTLATPKYSLAEAEARKRDVEAKVVEAAQTGKPLSLDDYNTLRQKLSSVGIAEDTLNNFMQDNKVTLEDKAGVTNAPANTASVTTPTTTPAPQVMIFGKPVPYASIPVTTMSPITNGISPGIYQSFADSPAFTAYNKEPNATYAAPINNGTDKVAAATQTFQNSQNAPSAASPSLTAAQLEQKRLEQEALLAAARQQPRTSTAPLGGGGQV